MFDSSLVFDVDYTSNRYLLIIGEWIWQPKCLDNRRCQEYLNRVKINASLQTQRIQVTGSGVFLVRFRRDICTEFDGRYRRRIRGHRARVMDQTSWSVFTLDSIIITARPYYRLKWFYQPWQAMGSRTLDVLVSKQIGWRSICHSFDSSDLSRSMYISQYKLAAVLQQEAQNSQLDSTCPATVDDKYF